MPGDGRSRTTTYPDPGSHGQVGRVNVTEDCDFLIVLLHFGAIRNPLTPNEE